jgi:crotonobetainyl-CoA:carnitine CoA-transferase CaiB-like acyl-CoA transferase
MASLEEALHDPHFVERGLFAHTVAGPSGGTMAALPVPIAETLRAASAEKPSPKLGADNETYLAEPRSDRTPSP